MLETIVQQLKQTTLFEWLASVTGVIQVVMARYNLRFNFIAGIVSTALYIYVFYSAGLFAESALNSYYLVISVVGYFYWSDAQHTMARWQQQDQRYALILFFLSFGLLFFILKNYTSSTVPFFDALVSSLAWAGSWLLLKRKLENWLVLNASNLIAVPLLIYKDLSLTALLTLIYIYVAFQGYIAWKKEISN